MAGHIENAASAASGATKLDREIAQAQRMLAEAERSGASKAVLDTFRSAIDDLLEEAGRAGSGAAGATSAASSAASTGASAAQVAAYESQVAQLTKLIADYERQGLKALADAIRPNLDEIVQAGPQAIKILTEGEKAAAAVAKLDPALVAAARQAGVNVDEIALAAKNALEGDTALMRAIAQARGWHDIPIWMDTTIQNVLLQGRKILAGVDDAAIPAQQLQQLRDLRALADRRGINFADWLRRAAGEVQDGMVAGESVASTAILRYFTDADITLLFKILDAGGDAAKLRASVGQVTQATLNGLGRATQAGGRCGSLDVGIGLQGLGGTLEGAADLRQSQAAGSPPGAPATTATPGGATAPGARPTDQELANVLYGTGQLGQVGLGNVIDQFGVTDRFTEGQGYTRAALGELWEMFTSPSQTTASLYYTLEAQDELLKLLRNEKEKLLDLGSQLGDASRALENLQTTLENAGLTDRGFLGKQGPDEVRQALRDLERVYNEAGDDWKRRNKEQMDERRNHINQKLADLAETVDDLNALAGRLAQLRGWLDSLRYNPDGSLRGPVDLFNPILHVRLGSIAAYLRAMDADAFGLTNDVPFRMVVPKFEAPPAVQPATANVGDFDDLRSRLEAKWRELEETQGTEIDPELRKWLDGLDSPSDAQPDTSSEEMSDEEVERRLMEMNQRIDERIRAIEEAPETEIDPDFDAWLNNL